MKGVFKLVVNRVRRRVYDVGSQYTRYFKTAKERADALKRYKALQNKIDSHTAAVEVFGSEAIFQGRMEKFVKEVVEGGIWTKARAESFAQHASPYKLAQMEKNLKAKLSYMKGKKPIDVTEPKPPSYEKYFEPPGS